MVIALITGATSGIGRGIAWQLAAEHMNLILVARGADRLEEVAEYIRQIADVEVKVLPADLPQAKGTLRVCGHLIDDERPVGLLVNNAGFGPGQDFVGGDIGRELNAFNVMVHAVLMTCHAAIPGMVAHGGGDILSIASMVALTARGTYSARKAWVRTFTEGLAASSRGTGVNATVTCPGLVRTELHEKVNVDPRQWPESAFVPAERVVAEAIEGMRRDKVVITPSRRYRTLVDAFKVAPRGLVRAVAGPEHSGRRG